MYPLDPIIAGMVVAVAFFVNGSYARGRACQFRPGAGGGGGTIPFCINHSSISL